MAIKETIWHPEPHTQAKHEILKRYLQAWLPIMSKYNGRILYIDGFAGPGEYSKGEPGSPVIAINAAKEHKLKLNAEILFWFIEAREDRYNHLKSILRDIDLPDNMKYELECSKFDETLSSLLDYLDEQKKKLAPAFVFIDPFGYSSTPFSLVKRIMENRKCEVLITFTQRSIIEWGAAKSDQYQHLDLLFGTAEWREMLEIDTPSDKKEFLQQLYKKQLEEEAKIKYVRFFEMINKFNQPEYFLFFGTNNLKGLKCMNSSMWKIDPSGTFQFSDRTNPNQTVLFTTDYNYGLLKKLIVQEFKDKTVFIEKVDEFVITAGFTHFKNNILEPMEREKPAQIEVIKSNRKRRYTYPPRTIIKFL